MVKLILVAGATGDLGGRIVKSLLQKGAEVRVIVRAGTDSNKIKKLEDQGVEVVQLDMKNLAELTKACAGVSCIVSALHGLHDVIVDLQSLLLDAAVAAGVPRFIPSDYSTDYTRLTPGENRNFDLRREFYDHIDKSPVKATSIFNAAFAEILSYNIPFLDFKKKMVGYFEDSDWKVDFTTMDDTAAFTAEAALDDATPRNLRIAGFQVSANEMVELVHEVLNEDFNLVRLASREELAAQNKRDRAANPEGENELYPRWQQSQYVQGMFTVQNKELDNERYSNLKWTSIQNLLAARKK